MKFGKFEILEKCMGPIFGEQLSDVISQLSATLMFFAINGKMDLEKLIWAPSISVQLPETFDLL